LLHDVAKPACTRFDAAGLITSRGHARRGAQMARLILWQEAEVERTPIPFHHRETIVNLVRYHGLPLWFLEQSDPRRAAIRTSLSLRCDRLIQIALADAQGRICTDGKELLGRLELFQVLCTELNCLDRPFAFASDHSRFLYFQRERDDPAYHAYDDTRCEVVLLSGLPASGKDSWLEANLPDWPVVSLDKLRRDMDVSPADNQAAVVAAAREQARRYLRSGRSFVWNATNTTAMLRKPLIDLFAGYGARVRIIYLDAPVQEILWRNSARQQPVPESVILRLVEKLEVPDLTEAHQVDWIPYT
jgi:predicted kinase